MSELMDKILAAKARTRKELASLPFDQKLDLMEKMRERNAMLAKNPLRRQPQAAKPAVIVGGSEVAPIEKPTITKK